MVLLSISFLSEAPIIYFDWLTILYANKFKHILVAFANDMIFDGVSVRSNIVSNTDSLNYTSSVVTGFFLRNLSKSSSAVMQDSS